MVNSNSQSSSLLQIFLKKMKRIFKFIRKNSKKNQLTYQRFQLTFIYFFATVVLVYTVKNSLGIFPELLFQLFPFLGKLLDLQVLKILATPEKTFIIYLLVLEFIINRSVFNFSILIKFNVLLIFILEMIQNLAIGYWDLFFNRENQMIGINAIFVKGATISFFSIFFIFFLTLYFYAYVRSFQGTIPVFPTSLKFITDSVAFWLQIKPSENNQKRKEK